MLCRILQSYKFIFLLKVFLCSGISQSQEKPNILWITFEDTSPEFIGAYGNPDAKTPVLDSLSKVGIRFNNAFSTGTVCSPSRSTIITGVRTFVLGTGNHRSSIPFPDFIHGFPYYLREAGYYTSNNSKKDYNVKGVKEFTQMAWDESSDQAGWWKRKPGQPFFAVFNFMDSHQSRTMTWPYETYQKKVLKELPENDRIADDEFTMPPIYRDSPEMRKEFARVYNSLKLTDNKIGQLLVKLKREGLDKNTIIFCFADHGQGMPRGKTNGIDYGYRVPFFVYVPKKYKSLSPWRTGGSISEELISFEDLAPTMLSLAQVLPPEHMNGRILMGPNRSKPVDFLELSSDRSDNGIDKIRSLTDGKYMYSRNYMPFMPEARFINYMEIGKIKQLMRKDLQDNKLNDVQASLFEPRPAEYLFDLEKDPWETNNLAHTKKYKGLLGSFRKELENKILESRDVLFLPEYEINKISQFTTPYEFRKINDNYPLEDIYKIAFLSGKRSADIAEVQIENLDCPNKYIRFWAILGLRSQPLSILNSLTVDAQQKIMNSMEDDYPPVSLIASVIAYDYYNNELAQKKIKSFIGSRNPMLALMGINYLLYMDNTAPFADVVKEVRNRKNIPPQLEGATLDFLISMEGGYHNSEYDEK